MIRIRIRRSDDAAAYEYFRRRRDARVVAEIFCSLNGKTIHEAAHEVGLDTISFLILVGHLYRNRVIREVRIV